MVESGIHLKGRLEHIRETNIGTLVSGKQENVAYTQFLVGINSLNTHEVTLQYSGWKCSPFVGNSSCYAAAIRVCTIIGLT